MADIIGTNLPETLNGTSTNDNIYGLDGDDKIYAGTGDDLLVGGAGNDTVNGNGGNDTMYGGVGDDTYYVDSIFDIISEQTVAGNDDGGNDRLYTLVSYTLPEGIERGTLYSTTDGDLTGNSTANTLVGNAAANILSGMGGNDTLTGAAGNDVLIGGAGIDNLSGGLDSDVFVFNSADATSTDTITDYAADDFVRVSAAGFGLSNGAGYTVNASNVAVLDPSYFAAITGTTNNQGTVAGHGQFLFNSTSQKLFWDADGSGAGAGIALATFNAGAVVTAASFQIEQQQNPPPVGSVAISDVSISEGNAGTTTATFTVTRTGGTAAFSINYATADGTATTANGDYLAGAGTLSFAAGELTKTISVTVNGDTSFEPDETLFVNLSGITGGGTIADGQGQGTITNDDTAPIGSVAISDVSITEGNSGTSLATFTLTRTGGTGAFAVNFATADGTATVLNGDYAAASGTVNFAAGELTKTITVTINGDTVFEPNETFVVNLSGATNGAIIGDNQGVGTITNDDIAPGGSVAISDVTIVEGNAGTSIAQFTLTRTGGSGAFAVNYATADGTASAGSDYAASSGTVNFLAGENSKTVSITINGDTIFEQDETFVVNLSGATNGTAISDNQGVGTISNDDPVSPGSVVISDVSIVEGDSGTSTAVFTVTRSGGTGAFAIGFATADGTATAGSDYASNTGTLNFASGDLTKSVSVTINGDTSFEPNETFFVNLSGATNGAVISDSQGLGTITNDDSIGTTGTVFVSDVSVLEGASGTRQATFTISRTGTTDFSVNYGTADGSAAAGSDYAATSGVLSFTAGQTSKTVTVLVNGDTTVEATEKFFLNLSNATNGISIVDSQGEGTITNDDGTPSVINIIDTRTIGSTDPSGLAYVPGQGLFLSDSEVDEAPFSRANNLFKMNLNGTNPVGISLAGFTKEPTGLTYDPSSNRLYMTDDDKYKVMWVDANNPSVKLGEWAVPAAAVDPEDIAINLNNGNLFIVNGTGHSIVETTATGQQVGSAIILPANISDPEALAYDSLNHVFYVGGGFSANIWRIDENGNILDTINMFGAYRNPINNARVHVKDLLLAPTSNPNDDPHTQSLYVADYGNSHVDDGRIFEVYIPGLAPAPDILV